MRAVNGAGQLASAGLDPNGGATVQTQMKVSRFNSEAAPKKKSSARKSSSGVSVQVSTGAAYFGRPLTMSAAGLTLSVNLPVGITGLARVKILRAGAPIQNLDLGLLQGGHVYSAVWDGKNFSGDVAASGTYRAVFWMPGMNRTASARILIGGQGRAPKRR